MKGKAFLILFIIAAGVAIVLLTHRGDQPKHPLVAVDFPAPLISLKDLDGKDWRLKDNRGNVVILNFWATWCDTCKEEMPSLQHLYDYRKGEPNFRMVTILYNDDPDKAIEYQKKNNFTLPVYVDPDGAAAAAYGLTGVPETYIVDKKGVLRKKLIGPADFGNPDAIIDITKLLMEGP